jgi:hypothetical protein
LASVHRIERCEQSAVGRGPGELDIDAAPAMHSGAPVTQAGDDGSIGAAIQSIDDAPDMHSCAAVTHSCAGPFHELLNRSIDASPDTHSGAAVTHARAGEENQCAGQEIVREGVEVDSVQ